MTQFLIVSLVAPAPTPRLITETTVVPLDDELVLIILRLRSVPPLFEPSIVTKSAPFRVITPVVEEVVIVLVLAGLIVRRLVALAPGNGLIVSGKVSPAP